MSGRIAITLLLPTILLVASPAQENPAQENNPQENNPQENQVLPRDIAQQIPRDVINDVDQAAVALHPATPYLEDATMLLGEIELGKIDVDAAGKWWSEILMAAKGGDAAGGRAQMNDDIAMMRTLVDALKGAGVRHLYASAATRSIVDGGPVVIIPCEKPSVVKGLISGLIAGDGNQGKKIHAGEELVLVGPAATVDRVVASEATERPDLILPLRREGNLDHHIVISLPREARRELAALWPEQMPRGFPVEFSPRAMAQDVSRITVTWRLPPNPRMAITIETPSGNAMMRVAEVVKQSLALAADVTAAVEIEADDTSITLRAPPQVFAKLRSTLGEPMRQQAQQRDVMMTMKQIGLAIHTYYSVKNQLPPQCIRDKDGNRLHSVRVALLPYIEQQALQKAMRLSEPWNSEHNSRLTSTRIPLYCETPERDAKTRIRFPVFPGSLWDGDGDPKTFNDITDGTSATIAAIHAPESAAVDWADPEPWVLSTDDPMSDVFGDRDRATIVLLDGAALVLDRASTTNEMLKAMLTIAGGDAIER